MSSLLGDQNGLVASKFVTSRSRGKPDDHNDSAHILLIVGMTSLVRRAKYNPGKIDPRLADLLARKPTRVATVAMANKTARVIWAIMARGETYRTGHQPALAA